MSGYSSFAALSVALALAWPAAASTAVARPAKLGLCASCHGDDGRSRVPGTPHLGGQDEAYLRSSLSAYRSGSRRSAPMNSIAGALGPADVAALARWYATRRPVSK